VSARPLYAAPVALTALTDEQIDAIADNWFSAANMLTSHQWRKFARAILAAAGAGAKA
jgi:hypothetical protein